MIEPDLEQRPSEPVAAKVAGAGSQMASTDPAWVGQFIISLVTLAIGAQLTVIGAAMWLTSTTKRQGVTGTP